MAAKKKNNQQPVKENELFNDDFTKDLIKQLNKENGEQIAFNLSTDDAPTHIKRWISTGSKQLDFIIANQIDGGLPEGRIVEIQGPPSCHARGDKIVYSDGTVGMVEKVKKGDKLLGPDGTIRVVLECHSGTGEKMYRLSSFKGGKPYTVTENHILNLHRANGYSKNPNSPRTKHGDIENISVKFSGNLGFHMGIPFKSFPNKIQNPNDKKL